MVILGANGAGKSTLLGALAGATPLLAGARRVSPGLRLGVFTQDLAQVSRGNHPARRPETPSPD